ncbi:dehydrogenase/reductase SDR family member 12 isoform X4 [Sapajus apella]|uniref:Dehydrogenase/reductase SDR family member 12 isoform X4 n=1 Tax=Sapajus apella TaxID=9515 RepID=A0A6J3J6F2_SAPAP|nr:dehydrogenase/reductase SDR family member 12 isoform X4 [Sapajus apella]
MRKEFHDVLGEAETAIMRILEFSFLLQGFVFLTPYSWSSHRSAVSRSGYESASKDFVPNDLEVQVPGRVFLVTGGNSGIGKATALEIAKRGGTVHLVCRDQARAEDARSEIIRESGNQITVSSGGMLVQKLNTDDLQSERTPFDGTMVYAQNKRQQVVLTEQWAQGHPAIHFSSMHPGWADTPGVRQAMPGFHARFRDRLRSDAQGADTVLWLALSSAAAAQPSGCFFQDRKPVSTHLPLARTFSSPAEEEKLIEILEQLAQTFK